jgi:hypothetical protein
VTSSLYPLAPLCASCPYQLVVFRPGTSSNYGVTFSIAFAAASATQRASMNIIGKFSWKSRTPLFPSNLNASGFIFGAQISLITVVFF